MNSPQYTKNSERIAISLHAFSQETRIFAQYPDKFVSKFNKTGHNKENPLTYLAPKKHNRRVPLIEKAKAEIEQSYFYPAEYLFTIRCAYKENKVKKNQRAWRYRSEMRETILVVTQVLLHYLNLNTMKFGMTNERTGNFINFGVSFIHKKIQEMIVDNKLNVKMSLARVRHALTVMQDQGYLQIIQNRIIRKGKKKSLPATIIVSEALFDDLGFDNHDIMRYLNRVLLAERQRLLAVKEKEFRKAERASLKAQRKTKKEWAAMNAKQKREYELPGSSRKAPAVELYDTSESGMKPAMDYFNKPPP